MDKPSPSALSLRSLCSVASARRRLPSPLNQAISEDFSHSPLSH